MVFYVYVCEALILKYAESRKERQKGRPYSFLAMVWHTSMILRMSFLIVERRLGWMLSNVSALTYEGDIMMDDSELSLCLWVCATVCELSFRVLGITKNFLLPEIFFCISLML